MARKFAEKDKATGRFLPNKTDEQIIASINSLDEVIDIRKKIRSLDVMIMKYIRGTLRNTKGEPITLSKDQAGVLIKYQENLMDKLTPNASGGQADEPKVDVVIKGPRKPR